MFYAGQQPCLRCVFHGWILGASSKLSGSVLCCTFSFAFIFVFFLYLPHIFFFIFSLSWNFNIYLISVRHIVKDTKKCVVELRLLAHSQTSETKLMNMTHLANNSPMLRCVREVWGKSAMVLFFVLLAMNAATHISKLLSGSWPRFKSISLSLWRTTQNVICQQKENLAHVLPSTSSGPGP